MQEANVTSLTQCWLGGWRLVQEANVCSNVRTVACLDGNVCINALQKYCQLPAWQTVKHIAEQLQQKAVWYVPLAPCVWVTPDALDVIAACNGFISGLPPSTVYQRQS